MPVVSWENATNAPVPSGMGTSHTGVTYMARVVQQRTSPPYLLIAMVFLFLIATTAAVLFYLEADKSAKQITDSAAMYDQIADRSDTRDPEVKQMMAAPGGKTVVRQFKAQMAAKNAEIDELTGLIIGSPTQADKAIRQIADASETTGARRALLQEFLDLHKQLVEANKELETREAERADTQTLVDITKEELQANVTSLDERVTSLQGELTTKHSDYQTQLADARTEWERLRNSKDVDIELLNTSLAEKKREYDLLQNEFEKFKESVRVLIGTGTDPSKKARVPDGKILMVSDQGRLCYINLGSKDKIKPGMTFSVYPPTGIPEDGEGKAKVIVTNVEQNTSECRLQSQVPGDPIVIDDFVANLAFDPTRTFTFVVIGNFDLYGTGTPTPEGAREAAVLIERFGGKVVTEVSINTDFVIRGEEPPKPETLETPTPQEYQVHQEQLRLHGKFREIDAIARSLKVPLLNTNTFLAFIGYTPTPAGG